MSGTGGAPVQPDKVGWLGAPFGRAGAALGFRWIMPFGTLPLPFHPWLARLLPLAIPALLLHRIILALQGREGGIGWFGLLLAAALIAVPLSIPIVSWVALAFGLPLIQGLSIGGAMLLLGLDAATGAAPAWVGLLPAAWLALFLLQWIGGPIYLRRLRATNAAFEPLPPACPVLRLEGEAAAKGDWLFRHADLAVIESGRGGGRVRFHRLSPTDRKRVAEALNVMSPPGWRLLPDGLVAPVAGEGATNRLSLRRHRAPLWIVSGRRMQVEIEDGAGTRRWVGGEAARVAPFPLFTFFHWTSIVGQSRSFVGFARHAPEKLGSARLTDMLSQAVPPLGEAGPSRFADVEPLLARLHAIASARFTLARDQLDRLLDPDAEPPETIFPLNQHPELFAPFGRELCARLSAAKESKDDRAVRLTAQLIAALPEAEYQALSGVLIALLNSVGLAFRLLESSARTDMPEREKRKHVIGGFSLINKVPALYERLAELGEDARPLILALGEKGRWPAPLLRARERLDRGRTDGA